MPQWPRLTRISLAFLHPAGLGNHRHGWRCWRHPQPRGKFCAGYYCSSSSPDTRHERDRTAWPTCASGMRTQQWQPRCQCASRKFSCAVSLSARGLPIFPPLADGASHFATAELKTSPRFLVARVAFMSATCPSAVRSMIRTPIQLALR